MTKEPEVISREDLVKSLLEQNYLPNHTHDRSEMPPLFGVSNFGSTLAAYFNDLASPGPGVGGIRFDAVTYRLTRFNGLHRNMGIPHPVAYGRLVDEIGKHWDSELQPTLALNSNSQFPIRLHNDGRIASMQYDKNTPNTPSASRLHHNDDTDLADIHAIKALGKRYKVTSDIANFYPSLYTHSIGWAAVGNSDAKRQQNDRHIWFNRLDAATRDCKRGETVGLLTGPGTSTIIAEYVLGAVDRRLASDHLRFVDDYVFYAETREDADGYLYKLASTLREFSLELNPGKTSVVPLPSPVRPRWLRDMNQKRPMPRASSSDIVDYIDDGLDLAQNDPLSSAVKLAMNRIVESRFLPKGFDAGNRLLSLVGAYPNVMPGIATLASRGAIDRSVYEGYMLSLVSEMAAGARSDGLVWSLYVAQLLNIKVTDDVFESVLRSEDPASLAFLSILRPDRSPSLVDFYTSRAATLSEADALWLLGYELYINGYIQSPLAHIPQPSDAREKRGWDVRSAGFELLKESNVAFIKQDSQKKVP